MLNLTLLVPGLIAFLITAILTPLFIPLLKKYNIMDDPKTHIHPSVIHTKAVPRGGGIPFLLGVLLPAFFLLPWNNKIIALYVAAIIALVIGVIDDKLHVSSKSVSPYVRFLVNILCAVIVVSSGISITFVTNPLGGILHFDHWQLFGITLPIAQALSILWIVWVMNMLNWSKGVDGQMPGIVAISAIVIGLLSLRFALPGNPVPIDATLSFLIAGASIGFLVYNFYPQKILPGYGATAIYLLLAVVAMLSSAKLATAILVMGVPMVDALYTIGRRLLSKRSIFYGDDKHLHHILLKLGLSKRQVAVFYWVVSAILGAISLTLQSRSKLFALILLVVFVSMILFFLHFIVQYSHERNST